MKIQIFTSIDMYIDFAGSMNDGPARVWALLQQDASRISLVDHGARETPALPSDRLGG
jgi:hypothetical protein